MVATKFKMYSKKNLLVFGAPAFLVAMICASLWKLPNSALLTSRWISPVADQIVIYYLVVSCLIFGIYAFSHIASASFPILLALGATTAVAILAGIGVFATVVLVLSGAFVLGAMAWKSSASEDIPSAAVFISTGLAAYGILLSFTACFPINTKALYSAFVILPFGLILVPGVRRVCAESLRRVSQSLSCPAVSDRRGSIPLKLGLGALTVVLGVHLLYSVLPERYYDALSMHLYIPSYMAAHGRWSFDVNASVFAHVPLSIDFLYAMLFGLGGEEALRLYNFSVLVLISVIMFEMLMRAVSRGIATWTVILFVTIPLTFIETAALFVENTLALWLLAPASILITFAHRLAVQHCAVVLVLLCAGVMAKLHGVVAAGVIGLCMLICFARLPQTTRSWIQLFFLVLVTASIALFPYIYAWISTGNPVFPFFNGIFASPLWPPENFKDPRYVGRFGWRLLWDATFYSRSYLEAYEGALGLGVLVFLPVGILCAAVRRTTEDLLVLVISLGFILIIASQTQYLRYFYPALPVAYFLIARAIDQASQLPAGKIIAILSVGGVAILNLYLMPTAGWILWDANFRAIFNVEAKRELEVDQVPEKIANRMLNELAGPNARVLYTADPFGALFSGTALASTWYNTQFAARIPKAKTPQKVEALFREMQIDYVVHRVSNATPYQRAAGEYLSLKAREVGRIGNLVIYDVGRLR
ncbi:hypothetical protein [Microvirga sp. CF3016]|uniref:hypothetical protein n=1 Tax=Microvirga sp. CF3016 TaxID=3110181 RepID=UPI002E770A01|nr:hypothetical protein [Microvirga sp. CF3016]MEE1610172.1 hypothetical protein [Microvirga sp. CF3016]